MKSKNDYICNAQQLQKRSVKFERYASVQTIWMWWSRRRKKKYTVMRIGQCPMTHGNERKLCQLLISWIIRFGFSVFVNRIYPLHKHWWQMKIIQAQEHMNVMVTLSWSLDKIKICLLENIEKESCFFFSFFFIHD